MKTTGEVIRRLTDLAMLALGAVLFMFAAIQVHHTTLAAGPPAGTVTVTATLGAFANSLVKVGTADTASASVTILDQYNPPVPPEDEGSLVTIYSWSATVEFSSTEDGTFAAVNPGSGTYTITLATPTALKTKITITPHEPGYWKVTASCAVTVTDPHNNQVWNGTLTTDVQDLTSAIVTFSPSPIVTGADKNNPGAVYAQAVATVAPAILANSVGVNKYVPLPGGTGDAQTGATVVRDPSNGTITFDVGGKAGTSPSMPNGDLQLEAMDGGTVLGTDLVIVQVPTGIGKHGGWSGAVAPQDEPLNSATSPSLAGVPANEERLCALATHSLPVQVVDQFGNPLGAEYKGTGVSENLSGMSGSINQTLNGSGTYSDPVGVYNEGRIVRLGNPNNFAYPQLPATVPASTENTPVMVAGYTLNPSVADRTVSYANGVLTITWP